MYFVSREDAVKELMEIHRQNNARSKDKSGGHFTIPLCDHVIGLGKSDFGRNYIRRCQEELDNGIRRKTPFEEVLCKCQTLHLSFCSGDLTGIDPVLVEQVVIENLRIEVGDISVREPRCIRQVYSTSEAMLRKLKTEVGPLFVVLDEMGRAFELAEDSSVLLARKRFFAFCDNILSRWFRLKDVFFLVVGRGAFFSYVVQRPENPASPFYFKRLPLRLLRVQAIRLILENTLLHQGSGMSLAQFFGLDGQTVELAARHLFAQTNGHPRSLLLALQSCKSYDDLMEYSEDIAIHQWEQFCRRVMSHNITVLTLVNFANEGQEVDMGTTIATDGKLITYDEIASSALIAWEGSVQNATLFVMPRVLAFLKSLLFSFDTFLEDLSKSPASVPQEYPDAFELLLMKRFQKMFAQECKPKDVMREYMATDKFGNLTLLLPGDVIAFPKITKMGQWNADPGAWLSVLAKTNNMENICLKPGRASASPDVVFATNARDESQAFRVTICLAARNCGSTNPLTQAGIDDEIQKTNRMFTSDYAPSLSQQNVLNVLFICSTNYGESVSDNFKGAKFYQFPSGNIHEVVVLDLTTAENRAQFFGFSGEEAWKYSALQNLIDKA